KDYSKKWASPKLFLPMQNIRETYGQGFGSYLNLEQIAESIKENGYNPTESIDVFKYNDKYCIYEGHHRNFACAYLGKTLIPYSEVTTLDENEKKQRYESINITNIYDHEDLFRERDENGKIKQFYYTEVYPDVYSEIKKNNEGR
ncbi:MAG: ParB-like nuclease domain-containing protein, partial [Clostridia bacterium]|nr:ParB-like nuclease domain-containing protein [Clostridia bacterium]